MNKEDIVSICKREIESSGHIDIQKRFPEIPDDQIEQIISIMNSSGGYMLDISALNKRWIIRKTPSTKTQFVREVKMAFISAALALLIGYTLWRIDNQSKIREIRKLKDDIYNLSSRVDSLKR